VRHAQFHVLADVAQRISTRVAEACGIGRPADAEGIENQEKGTWHCVSSSGRKAREDGG
jgi:hypothetical protein